MIKNKPINRKLEANELLYTLQMRKKIVAGNWKMNKNSEETEDLINELIAKISVMFDSAAKKQKKCSE